MPLKKRILIVCDSSRSLIDFRGKLIEKMIEKHDVYVFTPQIDSDAIKNKLIEFGVKFYESKLDGGKVSIFDDVKYIYQLYLYIKKLKPDIFFPYAIKPVIYGTALARFCKVKNIVPMLTGLGYNFTDVDQGNKWVVKLTRKLLKWSLWPHKTIKLIFQNKDDALTLLHLNIINEKHSYSIVNGSGVDLSYYENSQPITTPITFLMIARLINAKGVREYFNAAKIVQFKYPEVIFNLIGPYDSNIDAISEALFQEIKMGYTLNYLGALDDVRVGIKNASVIVLPSYREGIPRSILEGMAMGRPIITTDAIGCRETVCTEKNKENGFLVPIKSATALAAKMEHFINHNDDIILYGNRGRDFAREKFDVNLVNTELFKIMQLEN